MYIFTQYVGLQPPPTGNNVRPGQRGSNREKKSVNKFFLILGTLCCALFGLLAVYYDKQVKITYNSYVK